MNQLKRFTRSMAQVLLLVGLAACSDATKTTEQATPQVEPAKATESQAQTETEAAKVGDKLTLEEQKQKHQQIKQDMMSQVKGLKEQGTKQIKQLSGGQCSDMSNQACLSNAGCLLDQNEDKKYVCRAAKNSCEIGFVQSADSAKAVCEAKNECKFTTASCYCPEGVQCVCGGGMPSMCATTSAL